MKITRTFKFSLCLIPLLSLVMTNGYAVSDTLITTQIKVEYAAHPAVDESDVGVSTKDGIVTLTGTVDNMLEFGTAISRAANNDGVKDVNADALSVKKVEGSLTDTYLTAKLKGFIMRATGFKDQDVTQHYIKIISKNGNVLVIAEVANNTQKQQILDAIKGVKEVKSVKEKITVNGAAKGANGGTVHETTDATTVDGTSNDTNSGAVNGTVDGTVNGNGN